MAQLVTDEPTGRVATTAVRGRNWLLNRANQVLVASLSFGFALAGCGRAPTQTSMSGGSAPTVCTRPTDIVLSEQDIKLATAQIGKASIGGLDVKNNIKLVQVLSATDNSGLVVDYLMCEAELRGEVDKGDPRRVDYMRDMLTYIYTTHPNAEQLAGWQKANPPPSPPTGQVNMPDFNTEDGKLYFRVSDVVGWFRLMDDGKAPLHVWIAEYPRDHLQFVPGPGPFPLNPGQSVTVHLGILCCSIPTTPLSIVVRSDVPTEAHIEFKITDPSKLTAAYTRMLGGFASALGRELTASAGQKPAEFLAKTAFASVSRAYPDWDEKVGWGMAGSLLSSSNWPAAAVVAYDNINGKSASENSTGPLGEAIYLSGSKHIQIEPTTPNRSVPGFDVKSLAAGESNALVNTHPAAARLIVEKLAEKPQFRPYEDSLRGDIFLKDGHAKAAASAFHACFIATSAPTCQVRELAAYRAEDPLFRKVPQAPAIAVPE